MVSDSSYSSKLPVEVARAHPTPNNNLQNEEIWSRILQEVGSKNNNTTKGSVIFLGNDFSGKSSLIYRMTHGERQNSSSVLEYDYLTVHADPDGSYAYQLGSGTGFGLSDFVNLPLWTLDGKEELASLLKFAFPAQLSKCAVVLCASLKNPGEILPSLNKWYKVIDEQIRNFYSKDEIEQAKQTQVRFWQEYVEPIETSMHVESSTRLEIDPVLLPPEPGVLDENCGASVIVAITKSDLYTEAGVDIDKIQYHVRKFCLKHGAALVYTSAKEEKNTQLLYKYLAHRVFSLPFTHPAYIVENDSIFVPTGWDSEQKINIVKETLTDLEEPFTQEESFQIRDRSDQPVEIEDEQLFLQRLCAALSEGSNNIQTNVVTNVPSKRSDLQTASNNTVTTTGGTKSPINLAQTTGDSNTLASFFNSLLKKDTGNTATNKSNFSALTNSRDVEAHFQKILSKSPTSNTLSKNSSETKLSELNQLNLDDESESDVSSPGLGQTSQEGRSELTSN